MSFERLEEEMMGECRGRDKYTERIINEQKDPAAGQSEAHKLSLHDHRQMTKCGKRGEKLSLLTFMTLEYRVGGGGVCSHRSVLTAPSA